MGHARTGVEGGGARRELVHYYHPLSFRRGSGQGGDAGEARGMSHVAVRGPRGSSTCL